jgi:hypothetical protein
MISRLLLVVGAAVMMSWGAYAEAVFPRWDMRVFCTGRVAPTGVGVCVDVQLGSRDKAKGHWGVAWGRHGRSD